MSSPLQIYELLEKILSYLPYHDLTHSRLVNAYWNSLITTSQSMQQQLWKRPKFSRDPDAHFRSIRDDVYCSILKQPEFQKIYNASTRALKEDIISSEIWTQYEEQERRLRQLLWEDPTIEKPPLLCSKCCGLHLAFRYSNIHPLLQGIENLVCITGKETTLIASIHGVGEHNSPFLIPRLLSLAIFLNIILQKWKTAKDDMFTRPVCTRLVVTSGCGCYIVQNRPGITVREVVVVLAWECRDSLNGLREQDIDMGQWLETLERLRNHVDRISKMTESIVLEGTRMIDKA